MDLFASASADKAKYANALPSGGLDVDTAYAMTLPKRASRRHRAL